MAHEVFISYASSERSYADQVKAVIENHGYRCWMAPDSIPAGSSYADEIENAIKNCQVVVLMLSEKAQESIWVHREVERGLSHRKELIPFHIDESETRDGFAFFLGVTQRIEAFNNLENSYIKLLSVLDNKIKRDAQAAHSKLSVLPANYSSLIDTVSQPLRTSAAKASVQSSSVDDWYAKGVRFYDKGLYGEAAYWYRRAADEGDAGAQYKLGSMYRGGEGVEKNLEQARYWYDLAAKQGHIKAKEALAKNLDAESAQESAHGVSMSQPASLLQRTVYVNKHVGDLFEFGCYPQGANGEIRPITWRVLQRDSDALLVISEYGLDTYPYDESLRVDMPWADCTLRAWLNGEFYYNAFNEQERELILKSHISNNGYSSIDCLFSCKAGPATDDYIFLLSIDELKSLFHTLSELKTYPTEFAVENKVAIDEDNGSCWCWLRSGCFVMTNGYFDEVSDSFDDGFNTCLWDGGFSCFMNFAVRPALKIAF